MKPIEYSIAAGFLAAAIGFAPIGYAAAADTKSNTGQSRNKSGQVRAPSPAAEAPLIGRVVVTPSPEQLAKIRLERRMIGVEMRASVGQKTTGGTTAATGAL